LEGNILFGLNIHKKKMKIKQTRDSYSWVCNCSPDARICT